MLHTDRPRGPPTMPDATCPACGEHPDYCQGHGPIGDPDGFAVLQAAYDDDTDGYGPPRSHPAWGLV